MKDLEELIGKKAYYPIFQEIRVPKRKGELKKDVIVAWIACKVVAAKKRYGRIDLILQPKSGTGSIAAQLDRVKFEVDEITA